MGFSVCSVSGRILGGKEEDKAGQAVFLTPLNPFGKDAEEEKPHSAYTVPQKVPCETRWKRNQDAVYWERLKKAQDQGLQFWQTNSVLIMTCVTIPGDYIDRVTTQKRRSSTFRKACDTKARTRGHVEAELAKPAAAARTGRAAAHSHTDVPSFLKQRATWESKAEVQDESKHIAEADQVPGNWKQFTSQTNVES